MKNMSELRKKNSRSKLGDTQCFFLLILNTFNAESVVLRQKNLSEYVCALKVRTRFNSDEGDICDFFLGSFRYENKIQFQTRDQSARKICLYF